jgi:hypothetical protein
MAHKIKLSSGTEFTAYRGIVGITTDGELELFTGYDDDLQYDVITPADKIELADMMIARWQALRAEWAAPRGLTRLASFLIALRISNDENLMDMAENIGTTPAQLSAYETGRKPIPHDFVEAVALAYKLSEGAADELRGTIFP